MAATRVRLRVELLGEFAIICNGKRITEQGRKSSKVWRLLQYLITHRYRSISQAELLEIFCDDELLGSPGSILRTMVYRARSALAKGGLECADSLIIAKSGGYSWNNNIECSTDIEELEALIKKAGASGIDKEKKLTLLLSAAKLYKGDFLPNSTSDLWVMPLVRWYRSMYIGGVHDALELLSETGRNAEAEELCTKALGIDPFDELLIEHHLSALILQDKNNEALEVYKNMEAMFYDVLGVNFSDNLRSLYSKIREPEVVPEVTLEELLEEWLSGSDYPGAYYCDASVFRTIYQIESRSAPRSGRTAFVVRFVTKHEPKSKTGGVMKQLGMAIPGSLRKGDLFTRCSPNQYMLMLFSLTYEDCKTLISRIIHTLDSKNVPKIVGTHIKHIRSMH